MSSQWIERLFAHDSSELRGLAGWFVRLARVVYLVASEFRRDFCFERAASLSFVTLISLMPLAVLFVSFAGLLGGGTKIIEFVRENVFPLAAPEFQNELADWLDRYISPEAFRAGPTGLVNLAAILGLVLAALGLLVTAERVFNRIWNVSGSRTYIQKLTAFWVILTTSPFMIVASIWVRDILVPRGGFIERLTTQYWVVEALYMFLVPVSIAFIAFSLLYLFLPSTRVAIGSAAMGGIVAAVLWELSKRGFYLYVLRAGTVTEFYKQLAKVPLFFGWLYVNWVIILWGGEVAYVHQNLKVLSRRRQEKVSPRRYSCAYMGFYSLVRLAAAFVKGRPLPSAEDLGLELELPAATVSEVLEWLARANVLVPNAQAPGGYAFARHPGTLTVRALLEELLNWEFPGEAERSAAVADPTIAGAEGTDARRSVDALYASARERYLDAFGERTLEDLARRVVEESPGELASRNVAAPGLAE